MSNITSKKGFTLLELSLALLVVGSISGVGLYVINQAISYYKTKSVQNKMEQITSSIETYFAINKKLPHPTFEKTINAANGATILWGAAPVELLNLPQDFAIDSYGHLFDYVVVSGLTQDNLQVFFDPILQKYIADTGSLNTQADDITALLEAEGKETDVAYFLVYHGKDGEGSYLPSGTQFKASTEGTDNQKNSYFSNRTSHILKYNPSPNASFDDISIYVTTKSLFSSLIETGEVFCKETSQTAPITDQNGIVLKTDAIYQFNRTKVNVNAVSTNQNQAQCSEVDSSYAVWKEGSYTCESYGKWGTFSPLICTKSNILTV